jgi:hypothetical protein
LLLRTAGSGHYIRFGTKNSLSGVQLIEQRLGLLQIERIEAFREPAIDRSEEIVGLVPLVLIAQRSLRRAN